MITATLFLGRLRGHCSSMATAKIAITAQLLMRAAAIVRLVVRRSAISLLDSRLPSIKVVCKSIFGERVTTLFDASAKVETSRGICMVAIVAIVVTTTLIFLAHDSLL